MNEKPVDEYLQDEDLQDDLQDEDLQDEDLQDDNFLMNLGDDLQDDEKEEIQESPNIIQGGKMKLQNILNELNKNSLVY